MRVSNQLWRAGITPIRSRCSPTKSRTRTASPQKPLLSLVEETPLDPLTAMERCVLVEVHRLSLSGEGDPTLRAIASQVGDRAFVERICQSLVDKEVLCAHPLSQSYALTDKGEETVIRDGFRPL